MGSPLAGQVVFLTGAGSGIGAATAAELRRRGARLALFDRDGAALEALAARLGPEAFALAGDVCSAADLDAAVAQACARFGGIDIAWANAGIMTFGPLAATDPEAWLRTVDVNLVGVFRTLRAALPAVTARRGHLAVTASLASFAHAPLLSAYAATKAGVEALANALRVEVAHHGVTVGTIHPGWIATPLVTRPDADSRAFQRLRAALRGPLAATLPVDAAALAIAGALERRERRTFIPGWVRAVHLLRALVHTPPAEFDLRRAAPAIEQAFADDVAAHGVAQASRGAP